MVYFLMEDETVIGWHAGESRVTSAEGESGKPRISQAKGQRWYLQKSKDEVLFIYTVVAGIY